MDSMDDHVTHSGLLSEEPRHRRAPAIIVAVIVLVLAALTAIFWKQIIALPSLFSSQLPGGAPEQKPPTLQEKMRLLGVDSDAPPPPPPSAEVMEAKAALFEDTSGGAAAPAPSISADEKAKLLGGE